jgi:hypothetical protein
MDRENIQTVADLRMAVGYLGEKSQNNWWSSSFLAPQAKTYLSPIYPRTVALAQYRGVTEAALLVHDEFIGIGKNYHLFRLPEAIEHAAADYIQAQDEDHYPKMLDSNESALDVLQKLAAGKGDKAEGPVTVGQYSDSTLSEMLQEAAGYYLAAFQSGAKCYPFMREAA